jgi:bromodomain-containing protein 7/9
MPEVSDLQALREARTVDFGSFAPLAGALDEEMRRRGITPQESDIEARTSDIIRESLDSEAAAQKNSAATGSSETSGFGTSGYWNSQRAATAEEYIRDLVYGGADGLAYIRSLAQFVTSEVRVVPPIM